MEDGGWKKADAFPSSILLLLSSLLPQPQSLPRLILLLITVIAAARTGFGRAIKHLVGDAVIDRLLGEKPLVAIEVAMNLLGGLAGEFAHQLVEPAAQAEHVLRLNAQVRRRALHHAADKRLVEHHLAVGQDRSLPLLPGREQTGAHARGHADAGGCDVAAEEPHGVDDAQTRRHAPAGRVDVELDVAL